MIRFRSRFFVDCACSRRYDNGICGDQEGGFPIWVVDLSLINMVGFLCGCTKDVLERREGGFGDVFRNCGGNYGYRGWKDLLSLVSWLSRKIPSQKD